MSRLRRTLLAVLYPRALRRVNATWGRLQVLDEVDGGSQDALGRLNCWGRNMTSAGVPGADEVDCHPRSIPVRTESAAASLAGIDISDYSRLISPTIRAVGTVRLLPWPESLVASWSLVFVHKSWRNHLGYSIG